MSLSKILLDSLTKVVRGPEWVPRGVADFQRYFRNYKKIEFKVTIEGGVFIAESADFKYGAIVTSGATQQELDRNIEDAILTAFEIPSVYAHEAPLTKMQGGRLEYAAA